MIRREKETIIRSSDHPIIRTLEQRDEDQWLPLWNANCEGQIGEDITAETWRRICDDGNPVSGLGAWNGQTLTGILHYILHPTTGNIDMVCYMQDLFVGQAHRRQGIARKLVAALADKGEQENWNRIYWLADSNNQAAQNLYKNLGVRLDFTLHILPIGMRI